MLWHQTHLWCFSQPFYPGTSPNCSKIEKVEKNTKDKCGHDVSSSERFFTDAASEENYKGRLKRYIDFLKKERPSGIVEVTLADEFDEEEDEGGFSQTALHEELLFSHGFRKVGEFINSNSTNTVTIYHLHLFEGVVVEEQK